MLIIKLFFGGFMKIFFFPILFCLVLLLSTCSENSSSSSSGTINGKVINNKTYNPIPGVIITSSPPTQSVITDNDGIFKISDVQSGQYTVKAEKYGFISNTTIITVNVGKTTETIIPLTDVKSDNKPPNVPTLINPSNSSKVTSKTITLSWNCSDPDGDAITYQVFMDRTYPPVTSLVSDLRTNSYITVSTVDTAVYYWKVIATDIWGNFSESQIWTFILSSSSIPGSNDLVASYPFNGNASDETGKNATGVIYGAALTSNRSGDFNSAYYFDGINDYIDIKYSTLFNFTSNYTISFWLKPIVNSGTFLFGVTPLICRWGQTGSGAQVYEICINQSGYLYIGVYDGGSSTYVSGNQYLSSNKWSHVAIVFGDRNVRIYVNGYLDKEMPTVQPQISNYNVTLGAYTTTNVRAYYNGSLDDIKMYKKALSDNEIKILSQF
ncbi:MAG: hypothetical protein HW421_3494 [Ignavibacteria bacterium]|nr:hypothetical protein [Ignavibacteria bacterium]